jgi:hypothetical protein
LKFIGICLIIADTILISGCIKNGKSRITNDEARALASVAAIQVALSIMAALLLLI